MRSVPPPPSIESLPGRVLNVSAVLVPTTEGFEVIAIVGDVKLSVESSTVLSEYFIYSILEKVSFPSVPIFASIVYF